MASLLYLLSLGPVHHRIHLLKKYSLHSTSQDRFHQFSNFLNATRSIVNCTTTHKVVCGEKGFVANAKTSKSLGAFKETKTNRCLLTTVLGTVSCLSMDYLLPHG
jgi:hypothetical protein